MTRWLNDEERAAWLKLAAIMLKLAPALDSQLQRDSGLTQFDYLCLAMLSEAEERRLTMSELAGQVNSSLSRLSHVITKLESRGWVKREPCPDSKRVTMARLTDEGYAVVVAAAPGHVEAVRELVFDGMTKADVAALDRVAGHIAKRLDETDLSTTC
jgi:DNA-binding MarR family transcriptional regulator